MTAIPANDECEAQGPWLLTLNQRTAVFLRALAFRPYAGTAALILLCCVLFLPGIASLPVTDRDEARFAQASKQMLETGDYIDIRFQNEPRYKKPIGIYWLQSAAVAAAGKAGAALDDIWAYRIPSFLGALAAVLLTYWAARAVIGRESALAAAALFAMCLTLALESRIAKSDAALIASITLAQGALFRLYLASPGSGTRGIAALFWLGLGAGILIKGPVAPGLAIVTTAAVLIRDRERSWIKNLHWAWGAPLLLMVTLPWFIAIGISSHGEFFRSSLGQDFAGKLQGGQEAHWAPPGYYFIAFWLTFWPAVLFVTADGIRSLWQRRRSRRVLFLLAWVIPWWFLIEAIPTKLPHYALPLYPAIAIAAAYMGGSSISEQRNRLAAILWSVLAALLAIFLLALSWTAEAQQFPLLAVTLMLFTCAAGFSAFASWHKMWHAALCGAAISAALFYTAAFRIAFPALQPIWISETAAAAAHGLEGCSGGPVGFAGFSAPSLVFLNGTGTVLTSGTALAQSLADHSVGLAFVNWNQRAEFERAFQQSAGRPAVFLGCSDGIDINGRGPTRLQIYANPGTPGGTECQPLPAVACREKDAVRWRRLLGSKF